MPLTTGQVLNNRYRIVRLLGQGGFGAVYRAWDINLSKPCALKENLDTSPESQRQFRVEAQILSSLAHPNLPRVTDHFILPGQGQYLVMDYVDGEDLEHTLSRQGFPLPESQAVLWVGQVCDALSYLHSRTPVVIHRDIKPANIRINPQGQAMLVDFGIAKIYDPHLRTTVGARAVTPGYSPPEQYGIGSTDPQSDIYALGATLYTLLTCIEPPASVDIISGSAPPPAPANAINPGVSPQVSAAIQKAMALSRAERFAGAAQFKQALTGASFPYRAGSETALHIEEPPVTTIAAHPAAPAAAAPVARTPFIVTPAARPAAIPQQPRRSSAVAWLLISGGFLLVILCALGLGLWAMFGDQLTGRDEELHETQTALAAMIAQDTENARPTRTPTITRTPRPTDTPTITPTVTPTLTPTGFPGMVLIPTGEFLMGSAEGDAKVHDGEKPQHTVYLDEYFIDIYEVTNARFDEFIQATGYQTAAEIDGWGSLYVDENSKHVNGADWRHPHGPSSSIEGLWDHPVVQVTRADAQAFCEWAGGRLPTEAEWEKAARGTDGRIYPWGSTFDATKLNFGDKNCPYSWCDKNQDDGYQYTAAVGSYPGGASPYGLFDMLGNVWELVHDWYDKEYYGSQSTWSNPFGPPTGTSYALRSESWATAPSLVHASHRTSISPDERYDWVGFRCVRSRGSE